MPPQPARSISSYFTKTPVKAAASAAAAAAANGSNASGLGANGASEPGPTSPSGSTTRLISTDSTTSSQPILPSSPLTNIGSSPVASALATKRALSPNAARQARATAIAAALAEPETVPASKRMKLDSSPSMTTGSETADVFLKAANPQPTKVAKRPQAESRENLRQSLAEHPRTLELVQAEVDTLGEDWLLALQEELTKPYFIALKEFVTAEQTKKKVFPPVQEVHSWSTLCPLKDVRVVIIGQDPYHDDGQAHASLKVVLTTGLIRKGMRIPPSLRNIYKQMADDIPGFVIPKHGDLTEWAKHGVLLLNTSLTVRAHEAGSHSNKGWEQFTAAVLRVVTSRLSPTGGEHLAGANGVCFMAWGAHAQKMCAGIDTKKHLLLKSAHPSPLAAAKGFFGNKHFSKANAWLEERYGPGGGIDWASLGPSS